MLVYGSKLYGKVDSVPGFFHVATRFDHIYFVPLIPLRSYIVVAEDGDAFQGVPIPMRWKSVFLAWGRGLLAVTAVIALAVLVIVRGTEPEDDLWLRALVVAVAAALAFALSYLLPGLKLASFERAMAIGQTLGLGEGQMAEVARMYGRVPPRPPGS